jgi:hypothetical protein
VVPLEPPGHAELVDQAQPGLDAVGHRDRHRAVELHHGGRREPHQFGVQGGDLRPVGARRVRRGGVAGGDQSSQISSTYFMRQV